jgi:hypothetical protein
MTCPPPPEPVCTRTEKKYCFPRRIDCSHDSQCPKSWRCAALPKDAQKKPPEGWQGATQACFPEGLALALMGLIDIDTVESDSDSSQSGAAGASSTQNSAGCTIAIAHEGSPTSQRALALLALAAVYAVARSRRTRPKSSTHA